MPIFPNHQKKNVKKSWNFPCCHHDFPETAYPQIGIHG